MFIVERMKCRFHPFLPKESGWWSYPPHMSKLLEELEPLHVIDVTVSMVAVDGVCVRDRRPLREKYSIARNAVSALFGKVEEEIGVAGNCEVSIHKSGCASISLYWGAVWYLVPSIPLKLPRFACKTDIYHRYGELLPYAENDEGRIAAVAMNGEETVEIYVSDEFFKDPKPENAETFGDLCFLSQMREKWSVERSIPVEYELPSSVLTHPQDVERRIVDVLKRTVGLRSFLSHGLTELLIGEEETEGWRRLLRLLEEGG